MFNHHYQDNVIKCRKLVFYDVHIEVVCVKRTITDLDNR